MHQYELIGETLLFISSLVLMSFVADVLEKVL